MNNIIQFRTTRATRKTFWGWMFIVPSIFFFIIFVIYPLLKAVSVSFSDGNIKQYNWIGFENYYYLLKDKVFMKSLINTFEFALIVVPITVIISFICAALIQEKSSRVQSFFRGAIYLPGVLSMVSFSMVWRNIFNYAYGILNYILSLFGVESVNWLGNPRIVLPAIALVTITNSLGQPLILYLATLVSIPKTYYEAADIDGAGGFRKFINITVPLSTPTSLFVVVTTTIKAFQTFVLVKLISGGGPDYASSTILFLTYKTAFEYNDFSKACAMGVILFLSIILFSAMQFKMFSESFEY